VRLARPGVLQRDAAAPGRDACAGHAGPDVRGGESGRDDPPGGADGPAGERGEPALHHEDGDAAAMAGRQGKGWCGRTADAILAGFRAPTWRAGRPVTGRTFARTLPVLTGVSLRDTACRGRLVRRPLHREPRKGAGCYKRRRRGGGPAVAHGAAGGRCLWADSLHTGPG